MNHHDVITTSGKLRIFLELGTFQWENMADAFDATSVGDRKFVEMYEITIFHLQ